MGDPSRRIPQASRLREGRRVDSFRRVIEVAARAVRELIVLRAGDAVPEVAARRGEFLALIRAGVGDAWTGPWREVDLRDEAAPLPEPGDAAGFIVTGSASSVTERASWMLRAEAWLRVAVGASAPVLGICFGHQLLGQALGGRVAKNPRGREIGTTRMRLHAIAQADPLFEGAGEHMLVNMTHVDTVAELPPGATVLAATGVEPHAAFRVGSAWGVQFHPEVDGDVMRGYLVARRAIIEAEGLPHASLLSEAGDAPEAMRVMQRFAARLP
jgi:GMP synthase (glutamine-hydrolysing)